MIFYRELDQITVDDIQQLIDSPVYEGIRIEYKEKLNLNTKNIKDSKPENKNDFLENVSSFANASGGDLIYGIKSKDGTPIEMTGIEIENLDDLKLALDHLITDRIEPKLSYTIQEIKLDNGKYILIIRVGKNWLLSPHAVVVKKGFRFYTRGSNRKVGLDIMQLRSEFIMSGTIIEKIRDFRDKRISEIYSNNDTFMPLPDGPKIIMHLIPMASFSPEQNYDLKKLKSIDCFLPITFYPQPSNYGRKYNLEGYLVSYPYRTECESYIQFFRNGIIESVDWLILNDRDFVSESRAYFTFFENKLIEALQNYLNFFKELKIESPVFIFLSLLGVKDFDLKLRDSNELGMNHPTYVRVSELKRVKHPIEKDKVLLPEIQIDDFDEKPERILRPLFDIIWNACGLEKSENYNEETGEREKNRDFLL